MNSKVIITMCLLLSIGLLKSDASYGSYDIAVNDLNTPDGDYYNPEEYLADAYDADSDYTEPPEDAKHNEMDIMFGAFKVITKPNGADINLYDSDLYLSKSPSPVYPVIMDESMELREGIPGRTITLMITKEGYKPMKRDIFVPFLYQSQERALDNPSVFKFELKRDYDRSNVSICFYYSYANRHHRHRQHHHWFGAPSYYPWCPPGFIGWYYPPYHPGHGNHGHGDNNHHGGSGHYSGGHNPPSGPWNGGTGSNGDYPPHHNMPFPPPVGNGTPSAHDDNTGTGKPVIASVEHSNTPVLHTKPAFTTKPHEDTNGRDTSIVTGKPGVIKPYTPPKPKPAISNNNSSYQEPLKPMPDNEKPHSRYQERTKPQPQQEKPQPQDYEKPQPKPDRDKPQPSYQEQPKPKPQREQKPNRPTQKEKENLSKPKPKQESKPQADDEDKPQEDNPKKSLKLVKA